jgi:hypothetical protein
VEALLPSPGALPVKLRRVNLRAQEELLVKLQRANLRALGALLVKLQRANPRALGALLVKHRMANLRVLLGVRALVRNQGVLAAEAALAAVDLAHNLVLEVRAEGAAPAAAELVAAHLLALHARADPNLLAVAQEEAVPLIVDNPLVDNPLVDSPLVETVETPVTALEVVHLMVVARAASPLVETVASLQVNKEMDKSRALEVVAEVSQQLNWETDKSRAQQECEGSEGGNKCPVMDG